MPKMTRVAPKKLALGAVCAAVLAVSPLCAHAEQAIRLSPGESRSLTFPENPSTGYTWAIDPAGSRGLDVVAIDDGGHRAGGTMPGSPGERLWTVRGLIRGHAEIVFVYRRPWEPAPVDTRRVVVDVGR